MKSNSKVCRNEYALLTEGTRVIKRALWDQGRVREGVVVGPSVYQGKNFFYPVIWDGCLRPELVMRQRLIVTDQD